MKINICDTLKSKKSSAPISIVGTSIIIIDVVFSPGDLAFWVGVDSMDPKTSEYVFVNQIAKSLDQTGYELGEFEFALPATSLSQIAITFPRLATTSRTRSRASSSSATLRIVSGSRRRNISSEITRLNRE